MLTPAQISDAARRINDAEIGRKQIGQLSIQYPGITIEDAYAVQQAWITLKYGVGRTLRGHKVGLTSKAMQNSSQINEPDYGVLLDDMFFEDGSEIPVGRFIVPRLEVELAFILGKRLSGPGCTMEDVLKATDFVIPALEIIDARIQQIDTDTGKMRRVTDTISDNAASAGVVMGGHPVKPMDVDLRWVPALCFRNEIIEESGVAGAVLNHPANGVVWLANKLGQYDVSLEAGQVVLSGSFTRPMTASRGDNFNVDFGHLGSIACRFV